MPTIATPPDLTRTRAALAAYDVIDAESTDTMTTTVELTISSGSYRADDVKHLIRSLIDNRDFLCDQLSHATGLISEESLEKRANDFFSNVGLLRDDDLLPRLAILFDILREKLDTDVAAAALACDLEQAERLLMNLAALISTSPEAQMVPAIHLGTQRNPGDK